MFDGKRVSVVVQFGLGALAAAAILAYFYVAVLRISYPYELEWIEGAMVDHVSHLLAGQPLYAAPTVEFVPFIYAPFYFYLSALVAKITGPGFLPLRLISFVSSIAIFVIIYELVRRESESRFAAFMSVGIFAAMFRFAGAWFDIGRVDSLALALGLFAAFLLRFGASRVSEIAAAVAIVLAFHTKQSAGGLGIALALYVLVAKPRRFPFFVGMLLLLVTLSIWGLLAVHGEWYRFYVHGLPSEHAVRAGNIFDFWWVDVLRPLPVFATFAAVFMAQAWFTMDRRRWCFYACLAFGLIGCTWVPRLYEGAWDNNRMTACAAVAVLAGLAIARFYTVRGPRAPARSAVEIVCAAAVVAQFALVGYYPPRQIPTPADRQAGEALVNGIKAIPGDVLVISHGYLARLAGKRSFAHWQSAADIMRSSRASIRDAFVEEFRAAVRERRFSAILLDHMDWVGRSLGIEDHYRLEQRVLTDDDVFLTVTGVKRRPQLLFVPR